MILRLVLVLVIVASATLLGRWWQSRHGRVRSVGARPGRVTGDPTPGGDPVAASPDRAPGAVATAVLVSTPTCRTCPQVRAALDEVATAVAGFDWSEVDASQDLAFVRAHDVRRAPTVLFRDAGDHVVARAAGPMSVAQVAAAVGGRPAAIPG